MLFEDIKIDTEKKEIYLTNEKTARENLIKLFDNFVKDEWTIYFDYSFEDRIVKNQAK